MLTLLRLEREFEVMRSGLFAAVVITIATISIAEAQTVNGVVPVPRSLTAGATITENFDSLVATGSSSTVPSGFGFTESGSGADASYAASSGFAEPGNTYAYGSGSTSERAFGSLQSGTVATTLTGAFVNNAETIITSFALEYTGETWRVGALNRTDSLIFGYAVVPGSTTLNAGTFLGANGAVFAELGTMDYTSLEATTVGARDGNSSTLRRRITGTVTATVAPGEILLIRYRDLNIAGADDGLAIDDFSLRVATFQPVPAPPALASSAIGGLTCVLATGILRLRTRRAKRKQAQT
jgi:hypothetical protein